MVNLLTSFRMPELSRWNRIDACFEIGTCGMPELPRLFVFLLIVRTEGGARQTLESVGGITPSLTCRRGAFFFVVPACEWQRPAFSTGSLDLLVYVAAR